MRFRFRRLAQLEKLVAPYLARLKAEEESHRRSLLTPARHHAIRLGAVVLRGEPKLDEPLEAAWQRCLTKFEVPPGFVIMLSSGPFHFNPAGFLSSRVLKELPEGTEKQKFQHLFDIAPRWLLKFTCAFVTADLLGIKCPDLSDTPPWGHIAEREAKKWPELPDGTLQAGAPTDEPMTPSAEDLMTPSAEDLEELVTIQNRPEHDRTRDEQRRLREHIQTNHNRSEKNVANPN
jgi:hypothetical protein